MHKIYPLIESNDFPHIERMTLIYYRLILVINVIRDVSTVTLMLVLIERNDGSENYQ